MLNSIFGLSEKLDRFRAETITQMDEKGKALIQDASEKLRTVGNEFLDRAERQIDQKIRVLEEQVYPRLADDLELRLQRKLENAEVLMKRRAQEEVKTATTMFALMSAAVFVTGAIGLLIAWLHKTIL